MKTLKLTLISLSLSFSAVAFTGCGSSIKKADIPATADPAAEITKLENDIQSGYARHIDVLAPDDFERAEKHLKKAKQTVGSDRRQEKILDDLRYARAYYNRASWRAESRRPLITGILEARENALNAGARHFSDSRKELAKLDKKLKSASDDFARELSPREYSEAQKGYMDLELNAIQNTHLSQADSIINGAIDKNAQRYTPKILTQAQKSLREAANAIAANRHNPEKFKSYVTKANEDAGLLRDILNTTRQGDSRISEAAATRIVLANRKVESLSSELEQVRGTAGEQAMAMREASARLRIQNAMERARTSIDPAQAEAFQQGDKLLFRLKGLNFSVNRAELPPSSLGLLADVRSIITELHPKEITVTGHTDSTGSAQLNDRLSKERAQAVAEYLQTSGGFENTLIKAEGMGFRQPIANNRTSEGRAQNRRVDIVVVPTGADAIDVDLQRASEEQQNLPGKPQAQ